MPSNRAKELWNSGIPLSRAWLEFAPQKLRSEFENLPELLEALAAMSDTEFQDSVASIVATAFKNFHKRGQLEVDLKEHVLTELFNGQLLATGYRISPSRSQAPVLIDPEKFECNDPDWNGATFDFEGVTYSRIRITDPDCCQAVPPATAKESLDPIDAAIDHLQAQNPEFCNLPRKSACDQIRQFLGAIEISGNGLSNQNLAKAIVRKCGSKRISRN